MRENKLLVSIKFDTPRKAEVSFNDNELIISGVKFEDYHSQDCCESVYADFKQVEYYKKQIEDLKEIKKMEIKDVEDTGFIIFIYYGYDNRLGVLINCYNSQNGYYSDNLELIITDGEKKIGKFNISKYDNID
jgi:hypothetical protein